MTRAYLPELPGLMVEEQVRAALLEDLGRAGDITSNATIGPEKQAAAEMNSREAGVISGLPLAEAAFRLVNPAIRFEALVDDGARVDPGTMIARISGTCARGVVCRARGAQLPHASFRDRHPHRAFC
jgi:nicotinate-nucleotide pyrophosphorylase (carboxylating)